ncbi:MAG: tetratricopeptide repeat protein [Candidatus Obscuribacterales bacterium]|nr:tetratricopeptide repeat protein [Candidatus Obscuribacterales bacterium]
MGVSRDGKGKKKQKPDISKLWKATPTRIPNAEGAVPVIPHQQEAKLERIHWKYLGGFAAIIFIVIFALYAYSLNGKTVFNDDLNLRSFTRSYDVSVFWAQQVANVLSAPLAQPWVKLTYGLDAISFPQVPAWYHLVNVVLHATSCLYFYFFVLQLGLRLKAEKRSVNNPYIFALCGALLFACHPLASGAVAYISGRAALLASCNYFLCLNLFLLAFYAQKVTRIVVCYMLGLLFFFTGIACSFQMLTLPLTMFVVAYVLKPDEIEWNNWLKERFQDFGAIALYLVAAAVTLFSARTNLLDNGVDLMQMSHFAYAASCCKAYVTYFLRCFMVPAGLSIEPPFTLAQNFADPVAILGAAILLGGAASVFWLKRRPVLTIALSIATLPFIADLFFVQHEYVSDQKFYFALAGLSLTVSCMIFEFVKSKTQMQPKQIIFAGAILIAVISGLTVWREKAWQSNKGVWAGNADNMSARAQAEYGRVRLDAGALDEAQKIETEALQKDPDCPNAHEVLGQLYTAKKQDQKAAKEFELALESCEPRKTAIERRAAYQQQLTRSCLQMHDYVKAQKYVTPALAVFPGSSNLHLYAGQALLGQYQFLSALQEIQTAYTLEPNNPWVLEPLIEAMLDVGGRQYVQTAASLARKAMAVMLTPKSKLLFARAAIDLGRFAQAIPKIQIVLHEEPKNAEAMYLMGVATHMAGNEKMALDWRKKALAQDPNIEKAIVFHLELEEPAPTKPQAPAAKTSEAPVAKTTEASAAKTPEAPAVKAP